MKNYAGNYTAHRAVTETGTIVEAAMLLLLNAEYCQLFSYMEKEQAWELLESHCDGAWWLAG